MAAKRGRGRDSRDGELGQTLAVMGSPCSSDGLTEPNGAAQDCEDMTERGFHNHLSAVWVRCRGSSTVAKGCCRLRRGSAGSRLDGPPVQRAGCGTHRTNQRGQALIEMGLSVVLCVLLTLGI